MIAETSMRGVEVKVGDYPTYEAAEEAMMIEEKIIAEEHELNWRSCTDSLVDGWVVDTTDQVHSEVTYSNEECSYFLRVEKIKKGVLSSY